jgi:peptidoglycan hydrolase-like protein with peptidoglycan-binding domain
MDIKKVQAELNKQGYGPLSVDGDNGPKTTAAVKAFQAAKGLDADGIVGPKTLAGLFPGQTVQPVDATFNLQPLPGNLDFPLTKLAQLIALSQLGVREATGKNDGPAVETFLRSVGLGKGYAWCMAFVYWAYQTAAERLHVQNPLIKTGGVLKQWNELEGTGIVKTKIPRTGDIFIMDFGGGTGHTGIVIGISGDATTVNTIEGNTNEAGSRNGDGVYLRMMPINSIKGFIHIG